VTVFEGSVVLVTGAASGIGRAVTTRFVAEGATVNCTDRDPAGLDETIALAGGDAKAVPGDLVDPKFPEALVRAAGPRIDILANVAGLFDNFTPLEETDDAMWQLLLDVNLTAPMRLCRAVLPLMLDAGAGSIVNVASIAGLVGATGGVAYTSSKHGLVGLTKNIAGMYGHRGIRCNAVCPAGVSTNLSANAQGGAPQWVSERLGAISLGRSGRSADPEEIAALIAFLCSPEAVNINGATIATDGGWSSM
jgi:NAD(P)-dependent dehydrogenase (short-subunit alcohol dehydrogenase family)